MLVKIVEQPMDKSDSSTAQTQRQPVTPVSFASTTQVRMDTVVPQTVSQVTPQVPPVCVPLSQITSVASMANVAVKSIKTTCFGIYVIYNIYKDHLRALCY